mmetsp:Transcript_85267/g.231034  ORF Transcript_85267/g.231034 Transcript_85267/m.231034 type:complete len:96 (-) Transcript_85267:22-309(-)
MYATIAAGIQDRAMMMLIVDSKLTIALTNLSSVSVRERGMGKFEAEIEESEPFNACLNELDTKFTKVGTACTLLVLKSRVTVEPIDLLTVVNTAP